MSKAKLTHRSKHGRKKSVAKKNRWMILVFLLGFLIASYPFFSQYYYRIESNNVIRQFDSSVSKMNRQELAERIRLAEAFNSTLKPGELQLLDPFSKEERDAGIAEYGKMLEINERLGYVDIPKIDQTIPMYVGTTEEVLDKGAGLLEGTSLPVGGANTHTVITAHRGLPTARLFTDLDRLKIGDTFYVHVLDIVLAYQIDQILTVDPSNFDPILIEEGKDYATLLTCTPYMINSHRLLVRGVRVDYTPPVKEADIAVRQTREHYRLRLLVAIVVIIFLALLAFRYRRQIAKIIKKVEAYREK